MPDVIVEQWLNPEQMGKRGLVYKMKFETKIFLSRQKYYFDLGYGTTSILKYILAIAGIGAAILLIISPKDLLLLGIAYIILCYVLGYLMYRYKWVDAMIEVNNRANPFVKDMRKAIK